MVSLSFPNRSGELPGLWAEPEISKRLSQQLVAVAEDLFSRPKKEIRARMVRLGFKLAGGIVNEQTDAHLRIATEALEQLHAGTLIIDDIQDDSLERRQAPAIHIKYGIPRAICVGNWLYFSPLRHLSQLQLPWDRERRLIYAYNQALELGHYGQALDVGTDVVSIPEAEVRSTCYACMDLKSGTLTALALEVGALIVSADDALLSRLSDFGRKLGLALQCFDDLGNALGNNPHRKRLEDLRNHRPGFIWAAAHELYEHADIDQLKQAVMQLPDASSLQAWFDAKNFYETAKHLAWTHLQSARSSGLRCAEDLESAPAERSRNLIEELCNDIQKSYIG